MGSASFWEPDQQKVTNDESLAQAHSLADSHGKPETALGIHQLIAACIAESGFAVMAYPLTYSHHYSIKHEYRRRAGEDASKLGPAKNRIALLAIRNLAEIERIHSQCFPQPYSQLTVPQREAAARLFRQTIRTRFVSPDSFLLDDLTEIGEQNEEQTTKTTLIEARLGQGKFRSQVVELWDNRCSVTGSAILEAIHASHIKPWQQSSHSERLNPSNGLALIASLHALFDAGFITFESNGEMIVSSRLLQAERTIFSVHESRLRKSPSPKTAEFLSFHRKNIFKE